jgi:acetyl esterase
VQEKQIMPLDPQVKAILEEDAARGLPPYNELEPDAARKQMLDLSPPVDPQLAAGRLEERLIPGPQSSIPLRLYYPHGDPPYALQVYYHGGGWVIGDLETHDALCQALAKTSECLVVAVDYRLAPEHPYPAAVEDAYAATCWAADNAVSLDADPRRLAVIGDSAGGTLATVVSMMARDKGGPEISLQVLIYPITDYNFDTPSYLKNERGYMLSREMMQWFWNHYLEDTAVAGHPYVSPLQAQNLDGLPQAMILTAEYDPLCDEGQAYARKLQACGINTTHSHYEGMIHGFIRMTARLDQAKRALEEVSGKIKATLRV